MESINSNLDELKDIYVGNLIDCLGSSARLILDENGINKDVIRQIITINNNSEVIRELKKYFRVQNTIDDMHDYISDYGYALKKFRNIEDYKDTLSIYKCLIEKYYSLKKEYGIVNNKRSEINNQLNNISFLGRLFGKRKISKLNNELKKLEYKSNRIRKGISNTKKEINDLISKIDNEEVKYIFDYNKDIVLTLDYLPKNDNPFNDKKLDITMEDAIKSKRKADLTYFLSSNLYSIDENYLVEYNNCLNTILNRFKNAIKVQNEELEITYNNMSSKSKNLLNNNYDLANLVVNLNMYKDKYGFLPINYIYILDDILSGREISDNYINDYMVKLSEVSKKNKTKVLKKN